MTIQNNRAYHFVMKKLMARYLYNKAFVVVKAYFAILSVRT